MEKHRGRILIDSQTGEGTTVYFKVPDSGETDYY
ncbi:hypothetical protein [Desulfonatronospira sp. MSAO_Bac3]|nr:hypothetical protein [Desulfonatronospira sp. MSAO_Bac3]